MQGLVEGSVGMAGAHRGGRLGAIAIGFSLSLFGAFVFGRDDPSVDLVGNKTSKTYHLTTCEVAKAIPEKNKLEVFSVDEAKVLQLKPCPICKPPEAPSSKGKAKSPKKDPDSPLPGDSPDDGEMKPEKGKRGPAKDSKKAPTKPAEASPDSPDGEMKPQGTTTPKAKGKRGGLGKAGTKKADAAAKPAEKGNAVAANDAGLKFSEDIAPILTGNCTRCHNPQQKRGGFDLSTFQKLMDGTAKHKVITPGKPEESELVLRIKGESEGQKMPPQQMNLAPETIAKIEEWVKAGARLNAGIEPTANLDTIVPTPEARRKKELAKLSPEARDKKVEDAGLERWKKATTKSTPTITPSKNFLLFSNLPKDRADRLVKAMEGQRTIVGNLLGRDGAAALSGNEKISLYVFNELATYVEFVRSVENREVEQGVDFHGKLDVEEPYLAAADPLGGGEESAAAGGASKKSSKNKKAAAEAGNDGPDRTLAGMLSEAMTSSATLAAGKPPRWLISGLGAFVASHVDPRGSNYYIKMRNAAFEQFSLGWETKANEALGGEGNPETVRAIGFSLCEWLSSTRGPAFAEFIRGMLQGQEKLDDGIRYLGGDEAKREEFLQAWGQFVASRYGRRR